MTGYNITINSADTSHSIDDLTFALQGIQSKLQEGYKGGKEGELYWDLEEI